MRPRGTYGEIAAALLEHAGAPASVREIAHRAQVSVPVARYTASRLVDRGELVVLDGGRPARVVRADAAPAPAAECPFAVLARSFWDTPPGS